MFGTYRGYSIFRSGNSRRYRYWYSPHILTEYESLSEIQEAIRKELSKKVVFIGGE